MLRAVIPLMSSERRGGIVIDKFVALALRHSAWRSRFAGRRAGLMPGFTAVVRALNDLPEPSTGLRDVNAVGIHRRTLHVVNFPSRKVRPGDSPVVTLPIRGKNERAFARAHKNPNSAHDASLNS